MNVLQRGSGANDAQNRSKMKPNSIGKLIGNQLKWGPRPQRASQEGFSRPWKTKRDRKPAYRPSLLRSKKGVWTWYRKTWSIEGLWNIERSVEHEHVLNTSVCRIRTCLPNTRTRATVNEAMAKRERMARRERIYFCVGDNVGDSVSDVIGDPVGACVSELVGEKIWGLQHTLHMGVPRNLGEPFKSDGEGVEPWGAYKSQAGCRGTWTNL